MKTLVAFYSRTGCTRIAAETIAKTLDADLVELKEQKGRQGITGFLTGGYDAIRGKPLVATTAIRDKAARIGNLHPEIDVFLRTLCQ